MNQKLFKLSIFILAACLIGTFHQIWGLLTGVPFKEDYVFLGVSLATPLILLYISNRYWRIGMLFVMGYSIIKHLSNMANSHSLIIVILLNLLSLLFLIPAFIYFLKLRDKNI